MGEELCSLVLGEEFKSEDAGGCVDDMAVHGKIDSKGTLASSQKYLRFQSRLFLVNPAAGSPRSRRDLLASLALMVLILGSIESI